VAKLAGDPPAWALMLGCWVARSPTEWESLVSAGIWTAALLNPRGKHPSSPRYTTFTLVHAVIAMKQLFWKVKLFNHGFEVSG
jgi:hypothetical protein